MLANDADQLLDPVGMLVQALVPSVDPLLAADVRLPRAFDRDDSIGIPPADHPITASKNRMSWHMVHQGQLVHREEQGAAWLEQVHAGGNASHELFGERPRVISSQLGVFGNHLRGIGDQA